MELFLILVLGAIVVWLVSKQSAVEQYTRQLYTLPITGSRVLCCHITGNTEPSGLGEMSVADNTSASQSMSALPCYRQSTSVRALLVETGRHFVLYRIVCGDVAVWLFQAPSFWR
jgi:hypothetical protein